MQGEPTRLTSMPRLLESRGLRAPEARRLAEQPRAEQRATRQRAERRGEQRRARRQRTVRHGAQRLREARRGTASASGAAGAGAQPQAVVRRLYQIKDGAVISGVCKGLAAYLNIDVAVIRVLFVYGARDWRCLDSGLSRHDVCDSLRSNFGATRRRARLAVQRGGSHRAGQEPLCRIQGQRMAAATVARAAPPCGKTSASSGGTSVVRGSAPVARKAFRRPRLRRGRARRRRMRLIRRRL